MTVTDRYFPRKNPRAAATIYTWTLGGNKSAPIVAHEFGHDEVFYVLIRLAPDPLKLTVAAQLADRSMVDEILTARPSVATALSDDERRTFVMMAEANKNDAVSVMLAAGWRADQRGDHRQTALHWAGFHGNAEMAREILRYNPPLEAEEDAYRGTPLAWALHGSMFGWRKDTGDYGATVEALLQAGAMVPPRNPLNASEAVRIVLRRHGHEA
jgi:ankyrin repeat protein